MPTLIFTGSSALTVAPAARETRFELASDWAHPSFTGAFLPTDRTVSANGFSAKWRVPHLARSVPHSWTLADGGFERFSQHQFGVTFYQPLDFYDLVTRALKYGILFLAVGFMGVFMLELMSDKRVHSVQYLFVGLAMVFFYVLLLSLAEHIGFTACLHCSVRCDRRHALDLCQPRTRERAQRPDDGRAVRAALRLPLSHPAARGLRVARGRRHSASSR